MNSIRAVLLDIDGTLYVGGEWLPGAIETIRWCFDQGLVVRFITNTSLKSRRQILNRFHEAGLDIPASMLFTPARAAHRWFSQQTLSHGVFPMFHPNLEEDLAGVPFTQSAPADYVLVGDLGDGWTVPLLHEGLRVLLEGARLTALQQNRFWLAQDGFRLDAGAFVATLAYGADTQCERVFGKPSPVFFDMVLQDMGVQPGEVIMVGDDIESDVLGAQAQGLRGALVRTGKFRPESLQNGAPKVDVVLQDVSHLRGLLEAG